MDLGAFYGAFSPACFALPGLMSMLALIDLKTSLFWRISFIIVALSGAVVMAAVRGFPVPPGRERTGIAGLPPADRLGLAAYAAAIMLYIVIGVLAVLGGLTALRTEAVLQTLLVFLGFNVAWLLLLDDRVPAQHTRPSARAE